MRAKYLLVSLLMLPFTLFCQVDITKYASSDLFEVQPVFNKEVLDEGDKSYTENSWFDNEVKRASDYWSRGELDDAVDIFEKLSEDYPEIAFLSYSIGVINFNRNRYDESTEHLLNALKKDPLLLDARYFLGLIAIEKGNNKAAKGHFKILLSVPSYISYGYHGMGIHALNYGNTHKAYNYFKKCLEQDSNFMEAYLPSIDLYYGRLKRARSLVEKGIQTKKDWQEGIMVRGMISLLQDENTDQFEKDLNNLIELAPDNYHYYSMRGFLQIELKNYHQAVENFKKAYNFLASTNQRELKFNSKFKHDESIQRSIKYYDEHFEMEPDVRKYIDRGICEIISGDNKKGLLTLDSANLLEETSVGHTFIGAVYKFMWNKEKEAIKAFSSAIALDSLHWTAYAYRADLYMNLSFIDSAYADFDKLISLRPKQKEGYINRGAILLNNKYFLNAYKDFSVGLVIDPKDNDLYFNRATAAFHMGYFKEAKVDLQTIIKTKPKDGEAYYLLHLAHLNLKDTLEAIICLDSASKFSKYEINYHKELLDLANSQSQVNVCIAAHDRLVKYNSQKDYYLFKRAKFLYESEKFKEAIRDLNKYVKKRKKSGEAFYLLGSALFKIDQEKTGKRILKKAKRLGFKVSE